jgi:hypothetical protein
MPGQIETDFIKAKEITERITAALLKKYKWMKSFRFMGDIEFHPSRRKEGIKAAVDRGEEVSFGLNMELVYLDLNGKECNTEVIVKYKDHPFYDVHFKSYVPNPTPNDLVKQFEDTWIILASGGDPEEPTAFIVTRLGEYPIQCFVDASSKGHRGRWKIAFNKYLKWKPVKSVSLFGDTIENEFEKIRRN